MSRNNAGDPKMGRAVHASPVITPESVLFGSDDGWFYALDRLSGQLLWKEEVAGLVRSSPLVIGDGVCFGGQYFYKIVSG